MEEEAESRLVLDLVNAGVERWFQELQVIATGLEPTITQFINEHLIF